MSANAMANATFDFTQSLNENANTKVVFADNAQELDGALAKLNQESNGQILSLIKLNDFDASFGSTLHLQMVAGTESLLIVGTNDEDGELDAPDLQNLGGKIAGALKSSSKTFNADIHIDNLATTINTPSAHIAYGYQLRHYSFDRYKTKKSSGESTINLVTQNASAASSKFNTDLLFVAQGVHLARDLATEPGKNMYPEAFVKHVKAKFKGVKNIDIDVLDMRDIEKLGMGALAGVGKGSINDPRLLVISYRGAAKNEAPLALVGKGITFDTGGISLKSNSGMWAMKSDLSGAAAVAGAVYAAAKREESINVVGFMPLAENMPSQDAIRPGDVLETMKGVSIEIMSTDAEGRLILADAVHYAQQEYKPKMLLNIATLTGSAARALSDEYAAVITRDFELSTQMMEVGKKSGEHVWPLPLHPNHFEQIKSPIADIKNSGAGNPGASIGAAVVATFVDEDLPWVHLDIAGVDWLDAGNDVAPKGSQGWGVRFMDQLVRDQAK
ncbi:leucyl aminopeptidase family protein [Glaciecola sp. MH2013]|nr:leucyl aminopeptidase family protein [Glaciecola sp. MH2013]